jgi:hypothetical protein
MFKTSEWFSYNSTISIKLLRTQQAYCTQNTEATIREKYFVMIYSQNACITHWHVPIKTRTIQLQQASTLFESSSGSTYIKLRLCVEVLGGSKSVAETCIWWWGVPESLFLQMDRIACVHVAKETCKWCDHKHDTITVSKSLLQTSALLITPTPNFNLFTKGLCFIRT